MRFAECPSCGVTGFLVQSDRMGTVCRGCLVRDVYDRGIGRHAR